MSEDFVLRSGTVVRRVDYGFHFTTANEVHFRELASNVRWSAGAPGVPP